MNITVDSSVIPYLFYIGMGVFLIFVLLMVYTGKKYHGGHLI